MRDAVLAVSGELERADGRAADAAGLSGRRAGAGIGRGSGRRRCGEAFISLPGETIRLACSTCLTSRSWLSTARDGQRRRRRLQSLAALNSEFVQDHAAKFAERVRSDTGRSRRPSGLGRAGVPGVAGAAARRRSELRICIDSLAAQAAVFRGAAGNVESKPPPGRSQGLCHMLLCTNEFLYIE